MSSYPRHASSPPLSHQGVVHFCRWAYVVGGLRRLAVFTRSLRADSPLPLLLLDVTGFDIEGGDDAAMISPSPEVEESRRDIRYASSSVTLR